MALKHKLAEWFKRYFPAEILSTAITLLAAWIVHEQGSSDVVVALVSTWTGNITYFGYILAADIVSTMSAYKLTGKKYTFSDTTINLRNLVIEFGVAEALDSLLIRPLIMYYIPRLINDFSVGIILAKLSADVIFYIPAIIGYELNKKYLKKTV